LGGGEVKRGVAEAGAGTDLRSPGGGRNRGTEHPIAYRLPCFYIQLLFCNLLVSNLIWQPSQPLFPPRGGGLLLNYLNPWRAINRSHAGGNGRSEAIIFCFKCGGNFEPQDGGRSKPRNEPNPFPDWLGWRRGECAAGADGGGDKPPPPHPPAGIPFIGSDGGVERGVGRGAGAYGIPPAGER